MANESKTLTAHPSKLDYFLYPIKREVYSVEGTSLPG
jgi:hypothetical protein